MTDFNLRELERRFRASGSVEDEVAWLRARLQAGKLSEERLRLAAYLGHAGAGEALGEITEQAGDNLLGILMDLRSFGTAAWLAAAAVVAAKEYGPDSPTPKQLRRLRDGNSQEEVPEFRNVMWGARKVLGRKHVRPTELRDQVLTEVAAWAIRGESP